MSTTSICKSDEKKDELCQFFTTNGYCTLGKKCKSSHNRQTKNDNEESLTEICFSFDTTGSMYSWLTEVRKSISHIVCDLFNKIPNIRISIMAHGDYIDQFNYGSYVLKYIDFCRDSQELIKFVNEVGPTSGGDAPECYEWVLHTAVNALSWSPESKSRALVIIGDAYPHEPSYYLNTKNIDWREETINLKKMGVTIYGIYCGFGQPLPFYTEISRNTGGRCLKLSESKNICQLLMALCLKNSNNGQLFDEYRDQLLGTRQCDDELKNAINSIAGMANTNYTKQTTPSSIKRLMADLNEIKREKLMNISIVPQSNDVFKWHINIKPLQGALSDIYIHLTLLFPMNYPSQPPKIKLVTKIKNGIHANITDNYVCLPLFGAENADKRISKYGSCWSAAYSITSLLVNISSIFCEIEMVNKNELDIMRKCECRICGYSDTTPYPPLESNKLPIKMIEYDYNDIEQERGVMIAGNILETVKPTQYWQVKSLQCIKRIDECVAWQFVLDLFNKDALESDIIFGFINEDNMFFGVNMDGFIIYDNKISRKRIYENNIKQHDVLSYILRLSDGTDNKKDELFIYLNYKKIGNVVIPPYVFKDEFYPMIYLKDTRIQLNLNENIELIKKIDIDTIYFMCNLPQNAAITINAESWGKNKYYKDEKSWNIFIERVFSNDILLELFSYLTYRDWIRCNNVCVYWNHTLNAYNFIDRNEINCFFTKESIATNPQCILGVGLNVKYSRNNWITSVSTEMDFLSLNAYIDYKINKGIWGEPITHFLPLIINEKHAAISHKYLIQCIYSICNKDTNTTLPTIDFAETALLAITCIMNQFVVQLMNTVSTDIIDAKHASEKALIGYCAFHHLLLYLSSSYPAIKQLATDRVRRFINDETYRHKSFTPDLGKFLLNLTICDQYNWDDLKEAFIGESTVRNVKWYLAKYPNLANLDTDKCSDNERIASTLISTIISRRLVQFQIWFIINIATPNNGKSLKQLLLNYNKTWGRPTNLQKNKLMKQIKVILTKSNEIIFDYKQWIDYFNVVGIGHKFATKEDVVIFLKNNIAKSREKSYHYDPYPQQQYVAHSVNNNTNLYIRGLWKDCTQIELDDLFKQFGVISQSRVYGDGAGFVRFEQNHQAKAAIETMDKAKLDRCQDELQVKYAMEQHRSRQQRNNNTNNVYLRCLPRGFTESQLIELCQPFGELTCTRLRETRVAFVRYRKAEDALVAIRQLHGKRFENHTETLLAKLANNDPFLI